MKAIILAAGKGARLLELTKDIPKPMLMVNGKPILERIIKWLLANGIYDIGINLFTMPEKISNYFGDGKKFSVKIHYIHENKLSGTAGAIASFNNWLKGEENFIVIYGDVITNQSLTPLINIHCKNKAFASLFLHKRIKSNSYIEIDSNNKIINFIERPEKEELENLLKDNKGNFLVNSAIQILNQKVLEYVIDNNCFDLPKDVYAKTFQKEKIYGMVLKGKRVAIDSPERLFLAEKLFTD